MLLVDTSAWIEVFRKPARLDLDTVGGLDEIVTCLPVVQEVLQGFRDESAFRVARDAMLALPCVESPLPQARVEEAAGLYRAARRAGFTVRTGIDCLMRACSKTTVAVRKVFARYRRICCARSVDGGTSPFKRM